jgi:hypothetical protein
MVPGHRRRRELRATVEEDRQQIVPRADRFEQNVGLRTGRRELLGDSKRYWALVT